MTQVVLASGSPRRRDLLTEVGLPFVVRTPDVDETPNPDEAPDAYVLRVARAKADAVRSAPDELVIAADTTIDLDGEILGKPAVDADAASMLRRLSARTHHVHTAVAVRCGDRRFAEVCTTQVTFASLDDRIIEWYVGTGEATGKAGSYAIQGAGSGLVQGVSGSVSNVIGLPLHVVVDLAGRCGVDILAAPQRSGADSE
jgi:septum formation protein